MKQFDKVTNLKLRLGYGRTGSSAIDPYMTQNLLNTGKTATGSDNVPYYAPSSTFPEDLKWETTSQWDIGADLGLFNQRLRFTADYYYKKDDRPVEYGFFTVFVRIFIDSPEYRQYE